MNKYYCLSSTSQSPSLGRRDNLCYITSFFIPIYIPFILIIQLFLHMLFLYSLTISIRLHFHLCPTISYSSFHLFFSRHHILPNSGLLHYSFFYQLSYTALCLSTRILVLAPTCCDVYCHQLQRDSIHLLCTTSLL
jgi:uncharacterized membrane protein